MSAKETGLSPRCGRSEMMRYACAVAGFALLYAVCVSFYYRSWLFGYSDVPLLSAGKLLNVVIGVVSIGLVVYVGSRLPFRGTLCVAIGLVLLLAASALSYYAISCGGGKEAYVVAVACAAAGMSLAQPCCYELFSRYSPRWIACAYGVVASGGMLLGLAAEMFGSAVLLGSNLVFLAGSATLLIGAQRGDSLLYRQQAQKCGPAQGAGKRPSASAWKKFADTFLVAVVCVFAISMVYGALSTTASEANIPRDLSAPMAQLGGFIVAILFLVYFGLKKKKPSVLLFNVIFGVLGAAILLLPFLQHSYSAFLYAFASAAWKLMVLILLYLVAITYAHDRRKLLMGITLACALPRIGLSVGTAVVDSLGVGLESDFMRLTALAVFFLYLMLMVVWFINSFERKRAEDRARTSDEILERYSAAQENVRVLRVDALAEKAGLTKREREVLAMLSQGRDLAYMCDELCLSRNTVKGYQKSIYAKMGVHSKQEVIDLMDCS